jgi:hypothetical protein
MSERESEMRHRSIAQILPADWDSAPFTMASEIRDLLKQKIDQGTSIDSGCGNGHADLWFSVGGIEFYLTLSRSNRQIGIDSKC